MEVARRLLGRVVVERSRVTCARYEARGLVVISEVECPS